METTEQAARAWTAGHLVVGKPCATGFMVEIEQEEHPGRSIVVARVSPKYAEMFAAAPDLYAALQLALELFEGEDPASSADSYDAVYAARLERRDQIEQSIRLALSKARKGGG